MKTSGPSKHILTSPHSHSDFLAAVSKFFAQRWWGGISALAGIIAMGLAMATVIYSAITVRAANEQSRKADEAARESERQSMEYLERLDEQTARLTEALLRPQVRFIVSNRANQAIHNYKGLIAANGARTVPQIWVPIINVGLAVAEKIDIGWTSEPDQGLPTDTFSMMSHVFHFIPAQSDIQVLAFRISPDDHPLGAGFIHLHVKYSDLMGTRYHYQAKLRYAQSGGVPGLIEDSTEVIE
ncbi:hypothetical protein NZD89_28665 (plasmid) [Alicyclobacillus fastidiosus]|uniref:Uncharacterized protein n=1 Tax=Alicyclobacillus fastidiosus TaxID=392011 RepID=A0ABY6ZPP3_9BACL|nr:hypothetical protein [Alicyclobacillus fastidiosus]WAH44830.1 hypothetical protein NZD89_28665 [Alicyclobacillus fastidiosus]GMA65795.1 hypothetical protein GCM10025859_62350 [Alicyclobacillus fastidiosus]GMA65867.1 hypothetical protein GCM10025859_63080 [Alicyclobacillus fastidiosus]